jgi:transcription antitermination factor NusG
VSDWCAVQVWAGREHRSATHLRLRGYESFCPVYYEQRRWSDRIKTVERALFSGYVFCRLDRVIAEKAEKIVTAPGVIRIVRDSHGPMPIPADEIESIQRITQTSLPREPWPYPRAGQHVRIERGPLRGAEGVVLMVKSQRRLIVSISLLQRSVAVDIEPEWVTVHPACGPCM